MLFATETSPWLALVLAVIGGGAVGSLLTTYWRTRHERAEAWCSRLLDAADDFATGALQALMRLESNGDWLWLSHEGGVLGLSHDEREAMREADALIDQARSRIARVHLLYGTYSAAGASATHVIENLRTVSQAFWGDPDSELIDFSAASGAMDGVRDSLEKFGAEARNASWSARKPRRDEATEPAPTLPPEDPEDDA
jgi:hypothetical protein